MDGSVACAGFGWLYLRASITVSTIAGNPGPAAPELEENHVTYTSNWCRRPFVPDAVWARCSGGWCRRARRSGSPSRRWARCRSRGLSPAPSGRAG